MVENRQRVATCLTGQIRRRSQMARYLLGKSISRVRADVYTDEFNLFNRQLVRLSAL